MLDLFQNPFQANIINFLLEKIQLISWSEIRALLLLHLLGISVVSLWIKSLKLREVIGLIFPAGLGILGFILFFYLLFFPEGTSFRGLEWLMLLFSVLFLTGHVLRCRQNQEPIGFPPGFFKFEIKKILFNAVELICALMIVYVVGIISLKGIFWPVFDWDAITTFDFYGRVIVAEGRLVTSVVEDGTIGSGVAYPPLTHLMIAFSYLSGFSEPKFMFTLTYLSLVITFYAFLRRIVNRTGALILVLFLVSAPELTGFAAICKTNILQTLYSTAGMLLLFTWNKKPQSKLLMLSALMLSLNAWVRSEGLEFILIALLVLAWKLFKKEIDWKTLVYFAIIALLPFISWQFYLKAHPPLAVFQQVEIIKSLFYDSERLNTIFSYLFEHFKSSQLFGLTFYAFLPFVVLYLLFIRKEKDHTILLSFIGVILLHIFILYQLEYKGGNMIWLLKYSLKRYVFNYVPICLFFIASTYAFNFITQKIEQFLKLKLRVVGEASDSMD